MTNSIGTAARNTLANSTRYVIRPWGSAFSVWDEQAHGWATEGPISEATAHEVIDRLTGVE